MGFIDIPVAKAGEDTNASEQVQSNESDYKRGQAQVCSADEYFQVSSSSLFHDFRGSSTSAC